MPEFEKGMGISDMDLKAMRGHRKQGGQRKSSI